MNAQVVRASVDNWCAFCEEMSRLIELIYPRLRLLYYKRVTLVAISKHKERSMLQAKLAKFTALHGENWLALTTFDAEGTPIVTVQRFAKVGERLFVLVSAEVAQRIHENAQVEVAPSRDSGEALGTPIEAMAVVVSSEKAETAKHALSDKYGFAPRLRALRMALRFAPGSYVEITPM